MCNFIRKNCVEPVPTVNNNVAQSLMRLLTCLFKPWVDTELKTVSEEEITDLEAMLEPLFVFALVWSIGCTSNGEGRIKFSNKLKEVMGKDNKHKFPSGGSVYDYVYNTENKEWTLWTDIVKPYEVDSRATYLDIIVPTFDSIRLKYVKRLLLLNSMHVLSPGPTGTGKSINIANLINHEMNEDYQTIPITFSAQTSANQTQEALDEKFEKRRKGVFGPSPGKKFIIFIDDLNMPKKEEYGA